MIDLPLLSLVTFLPTVGAAFILLIRGEEEVVAPQRALGGDVDDGDDVRRIARHLVLVQPVDGRVSVCREEGVDRQWNQLPHGRRRYFDALRSS